MHEDDISVEDTEPAYFKMNKTLYYFITISILIICIIGANTIPSILHIFDYMAAVSISGMQFLVPGWAYIRMFKATKRGDIFWYRVACSFIAFSCIVSGMIIFNNLVPRRNH